MTHTVPSQTLFGGCGPSVMLGTWTLPKPRLGTTGSQLLLGSGPSQSMEVEEQACPSEVGPAGPPLFRVRTPEAGWGGKLWVGGWPGKPSLLTMTSSARSSQVWGIPGDGPPLCHIAEGSTSPLISILKRQQFTKVSRKGVLPFTRRGRAWK